MEVCLSAFLSDPVVNGLLRGFLRRADGRSVTIATQ